MKTYQYQVDNSSYWTGRGRHTSSFKIFSPEIDGSASPKRSGDTGELQVTNYDGTTVSPTVVMGTTLPVGQALRFPSPASALIYTSRSVEIEIEQGLTTEIALEIGGRRKILDISRLSTEDGWTSVGAPVSSHPDFTYSKKNKSGMGVAPVKATVSTTRFPDDFYIERYRDKNLCTILIRSGATTFSNTVLISGNNHVNVVCSNPFKVMEFFHSPFIFSTIDGRTYTEINWAKETQHKWIEFLIPKDLYLAPYYGLETFYVYDRGEEGRFEVYGGSPNSQKRDCLTIGLPVPKINSTAKRKTGVEETDNYRTLRYNVLNTKSAGDLNIRVLEDENEDREGTRVEFRAKKGGVLSRQAKNTEEGIDLEIKIDGEEMGVQRGYVTPAPVVQGNLIVHKAYCEQTKCIVYAETSVDYIQGGGEGRLYTKLYRSNYPYQTKDLLFETSSEDVSFFDQRNDEYALRVTSNSSDRDKWSADEGRNITARWSANSRTGFIKTPNIRVHIKDGHLFFFYIRQGVFRVHRRNLKTNEVSSFHTTSVGTELEGILNVSDYKYTRTDNGKTYDMKRGRYDWLSGETDLYPTQPFKSSPSFSLSVGIDSFDVDIKSPREINVVMSIYYKSTGLVAPKSARAAYLPFLMSKTYILPTESGQIDTSEDFLKIYPYRDLGIKNSQFTNLKITRGRNCAYLSVLDVYRDVWSVPDVASDPEFVETFIPRGNAIIMSASKGTWKRAYLVFHDENDYVEDTDIQPTSKTKTRLYINRDNQTPDRFENIVPRYQRGMKIDDCVAIEREDGFVDVLYSRTGNLYRHNVSPYFLIDPPMWVNPSANFIRVQGELVKPFNQRLIDNENNGTMAMTTMSAVYESNLDMTHDSHGGVKKDIVYAQGFYRIPRGEVRHLIYVVAPDPNISRGNWSTKIQNLNVVKIQGTNYLTFSDIRFIDQKTGVEQENIEEWRNIGFTSDKLSSLNTDSGNIITVNPDAFVSKSGEGQFERWLTTNKSNVYRLEISEEDKGTFIRLGENHETGNPFKGMFDSASIHVRMIVDISKLGTSGGQRDMLAVRFRIKSTKGEPVQFSSLAILHIEEGGVRLVPGGFVPQPGLPAPVPWFDGVSTGVGRGDDSKMELDIVMRKTISPAGKNALSFKVYGYRTFSDQELNTMNHWIGSDYTKKELVLEQEIEETLQYSPFLIETTEQYMFEDDSNCSYISVHSVKDSTILAAGDAVESFSVGLTERDISTDTGRGLTLFSEEQRIFLPNGLIVDFQGEGTQAGHQAILQNESLHHSNNATNLDSFRTWRSKDKSLEGDIDELTLHRNVMYKDRIDFSYSLGAFNGIALIGTNFIEGRFPDADKDFSLVLCELSFIKAMKDTLLFQTDFLDIDDKFLLTVDEHGTVEVGQITQSTIGDVLRLKTTLETKERTGASRWFLVSTRSNVEFSREESEAVNNLGGDIRLEIAYNIPYTAGRLAFQMNTQCRDFEGINNHEIDKIAVYDAPPLECNLAPTSISYSTKGIKSDTILGYVDIDTVKIVKEYDVNITVDSPDSFNSFVDVITYMDSLAEFAKLVVIYEDGPTLASRTGSAQTESVEGYMKEGVAKTATVRLIENE